MTRTSWASGVAALSVLGVLSGTANAQHRVHGQPHRFQAGQHHVHAHQSHHHRFHHRPHGSRLVVVAPFVPFGYYSATSLVYSPPPVYYAPPPVVYNPPAAYAPPPPAPAYAPPLQQDVEPLQREVVFPSGRYVLRGDGINTPYTWLWIPNPPSAPPDARPSSSRDGDRPVYVWTDANGVTTWTDRPSKVPPEHRAGARREL